MLDTIKTVIALKADGEVTKVVTDLISNKLNNNCYRVEMIGGFIWI